MSSDRRTPGHPHTAASPETPTFSGTTRWLDGARTDARAAHFTIDEDQPLFSEPASNDNVELREASAPWKVLVVDDDEQVHAVTRMVLSDFELDGRPLSFLHAHSGSEARALVRSHDDIAVILLDVVMESDEAGLETVEYVRNVVKNKSVRIILRTGQPGSAPEQRVIREYDINDYREKTELTSHKLHTSLFSALRSYRDIVELEQHKRGLETVIAASGAIFRERTVKGFSGAVLRQLEGLLRTHGATEAAESLAESGWGERDIHARMAQSQQCPGMMEPNAPGDENVMVRPAQDTPGAGATLVDDKLRESTSGADLIALFERHVSIAYQNLQLRDEMETTLREIIYRLSEVVETRSLETGNHVRRVAEYSRILAKELGLDEDDVHLLWTASPLHDIGKVGVSDAILTKPGKLTAEEFTSMKRHTLIGEKMLSGSNQCVFRAASIIAGQHHEHWDGRGYPRGLAGTEIHIFGRITAVADVFDALGSRRVYKDAWELDRILNLFREERGTHFDPEVVDALFNRLEDILAIRERFQDSDAELERARAAG